MALRSLACGLRRQQERFLRLAAPQLTAARFYASGGEQKVHLALVTLCVAAALYWQIEMRHDTSTRPSKWPYIHIVKCKWSLLLSADFLCSLTVLVTSCSTVLLHSLLYPVSPARLCSL